MHHVHIHAPHTHRLHAPPNTCVNLCTMYINALQTHTCTTKHVHHQIPPKIRIYLVGLPCVFYEKPDPNEISVLNQLILVIFSVLFTKSTLFTKSAHFSYEKHKPKCELLSVHQVQVFRYERPISNHGTSQHWLQTTIGPLTRAIFSNQIISCTSFPWLCNSKADWAAMTLSKAGTSRFEELSNGLNIFCSITSSLNLDLPQEITKELEKRGLLEAQKEFSFPLINDKLV